MRIRNATCVVQNCEASALVDTLEHMLTSLAEWGERYGGSVSPWIDGPIALRHGMLDELAAMKPADLAEAVVELGHTNLTITTPEDREASAALLAAIFTGNRQGKVYL